MNLDNSKYKSPDKTMKARKRNGKKCIQSRPKVRCEWPFEDVKKLISTVKNHPALWNINCPQYKLPKAPAWDDVANCMGNRSADDCKAKWVNLRISLNNNLRKREKFGTVVRWMFFNQMMFLVEMGICQLSDSNVELSDDSRFCVEKTTKSKLAQEKYSKRSNKSSTPPQKFSRSPPPLQKYSSRKSLQKGSSRPSDPLPEYQEKFCEISSAPPSPLELSDDDSLLVKRTKTSTPPPDIYSRRPSVSLATPPAKYCEILSEPSSPLELSDDSSLLVQRTKTSTPPPDIYSRRPSVSLATPPAKYCEISSEPLEVKYIKLPSEPSTVPQRNGDNRVTSEQTHNCRATSIDAVHTHSHSNILKERRSMPICTLSRSTQNQDPFEAFGSYIVAELHSVPPDAAVIAKSKLTRALVEIMDEVRSMIT